MMVELVEQWGKHVFDIKEIDDETALGVDRPLQCQLVTVAVWAEGATILYRERMPVPVSMWQPWRGWLGERAGARADFFADPVAELDGAMIAPLICYEQLVVWPVLQSMLFRPAVIVATGNGWWTAGTAIVAIQHASAIAWARLFRLPLVTAFNR